MNEVELALDQLNKQKSLSEVFKRLQLNEDFQILRGEIEKKLEEHRNMLEDAKDEDVPYFRAAIKTIRGALSYFDETINRHTEIAKKIEELKSVSNF